MTGYHALRRILDERADDRVEVTTFGGPTTFLSTAPTVESYVALARGAFMAGELSVEEFEVELERLGDKL